MNPQVENPLAQPLTEAQIKQKIEAVLAKIYTKLPQEKLPTSYKKKMVELVFRRLVAYV